MNNNKHLLTIARKYYTRCDKYNRSICSELSINGNIKPNKAQKARISNNNKFEIEWSIALGHFEGIPAKDIKRAIKEYRRRL